MIRTLNYDKLRHCIMPLLIGRLAFFAGEGLFMVMAERTWKHGVPLTPLTIKYAF